MKDVKMNKSKLITLFLTLIVYTSPFLDEAKTAEQLNISVKAEQLIRDKKYDEAITLLKSHAHKNFSNMYYYFEAHRNGKLPQFARDVKSLADAGNPFAAYFLARAYQTPVVSKKTDSDILKYYKIAFENGLISAAEQLAQIYYSGRYGIGDKYNEDIHDYETAKKYYQICLDRNRKYKSILTGIGHTYIQLGEIKQGIEFLEEAKSYSTLWALYYFGYAGIMEDIAKAGDAMEKMKYYSESEPDNPDYGAYEILTYYNGFLKGETRATLEFAMMFDNYMPYGVIPNIKLYLKYLKLVADKGSYYAAFEIGELYYSGDRTRKDNVISYAYNSISIENGAKGYYLSQAKARIEVLEKKMTIEDISMAQKIAREILFQKGGTTRN